MASITPVSKEQQERDQKHPEASKYLKSQGRYDPNKSEKVRDTYKEDRVRIHNQFNQSASVLFDKIFPIN